MLQLALIRWSGGLREAEKEARASRIDLTMLILFSSMYALFNAVYWPVCLSKQYWKHNDIEEYQQNQVREAPLFAYLETSLNATDCFVPKSHKTIQLKHWWDSEKEAQKNTPLLLGIAQIRVSVKKNGKY